MNKVRVVSLARNMPNGPPVHPYQILSNYLTVRELWPEQDFGFRGDNYIKFVCVEVLRPSQPNGSC